MSISDQRQSELDDLSVRVYQQLQAGYPIEAIRTQFDNVERADPAEIRWILDRGRDRYVGYYDFYKLQHRKSAKTTLIISASILVVLSLVLAQWGWPTHGRGQSTATLGLLVGVGGIGFGIWSWITADLEGRRTDIHSL